MVTKSISMFVHASFKMSCLESDEWAAFFNCHSLLMLYYSLLQKRNKGSLMYCVSSYFQFVTNLVFVCISL